MANRYFYGDRNSFGTPNTVQRDDTIYGTNTTLNTDYIYGYRGDDDLFGQAGTDYIYGGAGSDYIDGGTGNDGLYGETGNDFLYGRDGNDTINAGRNLDKVYGGNGNDTIYDDGVISSTRIFDGGADQMYGEAGSDTFFLSIDGQRDFVSGGIGLDTINLQGRMKVGTSVSVTDVANSSWDLLSWYTTTGAIERDYVFSVEYIRNGSGVLIAI